MKTWLLIYSKPRQESVVVRNLENQGFRAYSPVINVRKMEVCPRQRAQVEPLFPNYVFIHVDPGIQSISPVRSTRGVSHFIKFGGLYASVSEEIMNQIRSSIAEQFRRQDTKDTLKRGDKITVNGNGFNEMRAVFFTSRGSERAIILLDILGRESKVSVPVELISRAAGH